MASRPRKAQPKAPTPAQFRAARAFLCWSQADVAKLVGLNPISILRLENEAIGASAETVAAVKAVLESAGVVFTHNGIRQASGPTRSRSKGDDDD